MTTRPVRAELRHAVLAKLAIFTEEVEWVGEGANLRFADSIIEFADWLADTTPPPPAPRGPGASRAAIDEAKAAAEVAVRAAKKRGARR